MGSDDVPRLFPMCAGVTEVPSCWPPVDKVRGRSDRRRVGGADLEPISGRQPHDSGSTGLLASSKVGTDQVGDRRSEIDLVGQVKRLYPKLKLVTLLNADILLQGQVNRGIAWGR